MHGTHDEGRIFVFGFRTWLLGRTAGTALTALPDSWFTALGGAKASECAKLEHLAMADLGRRKALAQMRKIGPAQQMRIQPPDTPGGTGCTRAVQRRGG